MSQTTEGFRKEYYKHKRHVLFRLQKLQSLVSRDSDGMEFTTAQTAKLDRLKALGDLLYHAVEDFTNGIERYDS